MNETIFETLSRRLALATSRRGTMLTFGGTALAATATGSMAGEAKKGKNQKKKARKRCKQQVAACEEVLTRACAELPDCVLADFLPCCSLLASCQAGEAITCTTAYVRSAV